MELKIFFVLILMNLSNAHLNIPIKDTALDQTLYEEVLDAEECHRQITLIRSVSMLALQFADAGIRIPRALLGGNSNDLGSYDQCLGINLNIGDTDLQGKYCAIRVPLNQTFHLPPTESVWDLSGLNSLNISDEILAKYQYYDLARSQINGLAGLWDENYDRTLPVGPLAGTVLRISVCIPKPCTTEQAMTSFLFNLTSVGFRYTDDFCRLPDDKPWVAADYVAIVVFSIIGFLTIISTSYDLICTFILKKDRKKLSSMYRSFSVYTNGMRLTTFASGSDNLQCLDGIRTLAIIWIILGHSFSTEKFLINGFDIFTWLLSKESLWITSATISVDTFFTLGGMLLVYTTAAKMNSVSLMKNLHLFYLNRLLRMFPLLAAAVLLQASFFNRVSDGPFWTTVSRQTNVCRTHWWTTLLHLQNLLNPANMCIPHSWYIAIDVQLYFASPLILFWVLSGNKRSAWLALTIGLLAPLTASGIYNYIQNFPAGTVVLSRSGEDMANYMYNYYFNTMTRAAPFFVGMIIGYILHICRNKKVNIPWIVAVSIWIAVLSITTLIFFSTYFIVQLDWDNQLVDNLMNTFMRPLWGSCLGWIIFACVHGYGGPANWFLTLDIWRVPARLAYAMFIIHYPIMFVYYDSMKTTTHFSVARITFKFLAHMSLALVVSFILTILIDSPFSVIFKQLLEKKRTNPQSIPIHKDNVKEDKLQAVVHNDAVIDRNLDEDGVTLDNKGTNDDLNIDQIRAVNRSDNSKRIGDSHIIIVNEISDSNNKPEETEAKEDNKKK